MSRIGKLPIPVPANVDVTIDGQQISVKGPKGTLAHVIAEPITVDREDGVLTIKRPDDERRNRALHGLTRSLVNNLVVGVTDGYEKKLEIHGVGYRVQLKGSDLEFSLGYSHPVKVTPPEGITFVGRGTDPVLRAGDRQAAGRRGRREHPQAAQARPVQGQGCAVRGREDPPQGRKDG